MRFSMGVLCALLLAGCATPNGRNTTADAIQREMSQAVVESVQASKPEAVRDALLPPLVVELPIVESQSP